jgi:quinol monooxygenase YgiN
MLLLKTRMPMKRYRKLMVSLFGCALLSELQTVLAQETPLPIVAVIHVDVMPQYAPSAAVLLVQLRHDSLRDSGERNFQVLREIGRPNHFTLVEEWADQKAYDAHNSAPHTRQFRDLLQPMLGSPFDERLHTELPGKDK